MEAGGDDEDGEEDSLDFISRHEEELVRVRRGESLSMVIWHCALPCGDLWLGCWLSLSFIFTSVITCYAEIPFMLNTNFL